MHKTISFAGIHFTVAILKVDDNKTPKPLTMLNIVPKQPLPNYTIPWSNWKKV